LKDNLLTLVGAVVGGVVGHFAFKWLLQQGFYALILPGGFVGLGAGVFKSKSAAVSIVCGVLALALGLYTQWRFMVPRTADDSLGYFLAHLLDLRPLTLIMISLGAFIGFWVPFRRRQEAVAGAAGLL
jgi:hypothetical protein